MIGAVIAGIVLVAIGTLFIVSAFRKSLRCTASATATIIKIDLEPKRVQDDVGLYEPVFEFTTASGQTIREKGSSSSSRKSTFNIGDTKEVRYNPAKPTEFISGKQTVSYAIGALIVAIGIIMIITYYFL